MAYVEDRVCLPKLFSLAAIEPVFFAVFFGVFFFLLFLLDYLPLVSKCFY